MITFDMRAFEEAARSMKAAQDQLPFAISLALNKAAAATENRLAAETWPRHVTVRNKGFLKAALKIEPASKRSLRVAIYDDLGRASLSLHDKGGTKKARGNFAIPTSRVARGARGVPRGQRPASLKRKVVKGGLIFQAVGKGAAQRLQLMFKLQPTTQVKADVPFTRDFQRFMREEVRREFPKAMLKAMRTRR